MFDWFFGNKELVRAVRYIAVAVAGIASVVNAFVAPKALEYDLKDAEDHVYERVKEDKKKDEKKEKES